MSHPVSWMMSIAPVSTGFVGSVPSTSGRTLRLMLGAASRNVAGNDNAIATPKLPFRHAAGVKP